MLAIGVSRFVTKVGNSIILNLAYKRHHLWQNDRMIVYLTASLRVSGLETKLVIEGLNVHTFVLSFRKAYGGHDRVETIDDRKTSYIWNIKVLRKYDSFCSYFAFSICFFHTFKGK